MRVNVMVRERSNTKHAQPPATWLLRPARDAHTADHNKTGHTHSPHIRHSTPVIFATRASERGARAPREARQQRARRRRIAGAPRPQLSHATPPHTALPRVLLPPLPPHHNMPTPSAYWLLRLSRWPQ
eukprot:5399679-Prymnesium_polylepis.1